MVPKDLLGRVAKRFKVLSEPIRLELLNLLMAHGEMSVMALVDASGHRQSNVSKHLNILAREGVLIRRREGLKVFYKIDDPSLHSICTLVCGRLEAESAGEQGSPAVAVRTLTHPHPKKRGRPTRHSKKH